VTTPIVLDCDPGHDDPIALLLALASPEVELLGVTTTYGNQTLEKTTQNALRVLELVERPDVPVASGAERPLERDLVVAFHVHGESGLDGPELPPATIAPRSEDAVAFIHELVSRQERPVTLVPTGPLTNVARYLDAHGGEGVGRIVLMGGAIAEGNYTPAAEFNIWCDPEAARRVFESGVDVTMIGLDVTHQALLTDEHTEELRAAGRVGKLVAELMDFYAHFHREMYPDLDGTPIHDPVAVAHVAVPGLVEVRDALVSVDCGWEQGRGRTNVDLRGRGDERNAKVGVAIDRDRFVRTVIERVTSLG
jgi:pyrimidine-specific ribonucleoside hydrolase